jgi:hypothetical protein
MEDAKEDMMEGKARVTQLQKEQEVLIRGLNSLEKKSRNLEDSNLEAQGKMRKMNVENKTLNSSLSVVQKENNEGKRSLKEKTKTINNYKTVREMIK